MIQIDREKYEVTVRSKPVRRLTPTEFDILVILDEAAGRTVSRQQLLARIRGYSRETVKVLATRTIDSHVAHLRAKLGAAGALIVTLPYRGYRLQQ